MEYIQRAKEFFQKYRHLFEKYKHLALPSAVAFFFLFGTLCLLYGTFILPNFTPKVSAVTRELQKTYDKVAASVDPQESIEIKVDIAGAVEQPGVYTLQKGERLSVLIEKCGGFHKKADKTFIAHQLNLSQRLSDEQKVYIPFQGEKVALAENKTSGTNDGVIQNGSSLININTATEAELDTLDGIGAVRAQQIITGRPYKTVEELVDRKILSQKLFEQVQSRISF